MANQPVEHYAAGAARFTGNVRQRVGRNEDDVRNRDIRGGFHDASTTHAGTKSLVVIAAEQNPKIMIHSGFSLSKLSSGYDSYSTARLLDILS
jgi:hypothetical protein